MKSLDLAVIFWNREERRLRLWWRLIFALVVLAVVEGVVSILGGALGIGIYVASGGEFPSITEPDFAVQIQQLIYQPVVRVIVMIFQGIGLIVGLMATGWLVDRRKFTDYGFHLNRRWWADMGFGLGLGVTCMVFIFVVELAFGWIKITDVLQPGNTLPFVWGIGLALVNFILVGIQEEVFSRGFLLRNLAEGFNWRVFNPKLALLIGYFISSSIFGLMHLGNPNTSAISTINLVVAGVFLGLGFVLTGELAIPIGLHITWNFFQGNVFGFPVSGTQAGATFVAIEQGGPDWMTGGAFGPEAGVIGLLAIALGCWLTVLWVKRTRSSAKLQESLAVFKPVIWKAASSTVEMVDEVTLEVEENHSKK